jgi:hypothetical protein
MNRIPELENNGVTCSLPLGLGTIQEDERQPNNTAVASSFQINVLFKLFFHLFL